MFVMEDVSMPDIYLSMPDIHWKYLQEVIRFSFKWRDDNCLHYGISWENESF